MDRSFTSLLVDFIQASAADPPPLAVRARAQSCLLDTLGVMLAGGTDPGVRCLEDSLDRLPGSAVAVISPWTGRRYAAVDAALLLGMAAHMFDYDDVSMTSICHPSAPVTSALVAATLGGVASSDVSGLDFTSAHAVGTEVMIRLGQVMGGRHYALGFHATGTLGVVGAAAGVARLIRLDAKSTAHALAIAASMASGLRKNFGSMVKPLHVGLAASNGLRAARLAQAGVEGDLEAFEEGGYLRAFSGGETDRLPSEGFALGRPFVLESPGFEQKRYPCCYMMHKAIEGTLHLARTEGVTPSQLENAEVRMCRGATQPLIHPHPATGLNAKFSGPYAVIASLVDGRIGLDSFTDAAVARPAIQSRLRDVMLIEEGDPMPAGTDLGRMPVTVVLNLRDGRAIRHTVIASPGSPEDPMTPEQLREKWEDCLGQRAGARDDATARALFDEGLRLEDAITPVPWLQRVMQTMSVR